MGPMGRALVQYCTLSAGRQHTSNGPDAFKQHGVWKEIAFGKKDKHFVDHKCAMQKRRPLGRSFRRCCLAELSQVLILDLVPPIQ